MNGYHSRHELNNIFFLKCLDVMAYLLGNQRLKFSKGDLPVIALPLFLDLDRFFFDWSDWILDLSEVLCLG